MNRSFLYGDGIFETIRIANHSILYAEAHYNRAKRSLELLGMQFNWSLDKFEETILKESIDSGANRRVRITFFRSTGGLYSPTLKSVEYYLQHNPLASNIYPQQLQGLFIGLCPHLKIYADQFANIKSCSANLQVQAGRYRLEKGYDELILLNHKDKVAEGCAANIFAYYRHQLITPPLSAGCLDGVMRTQVLQLAKKHNIPIQERSITLDELYHASEIWMTNAIQGIKWVSTIDTIEKQYQSNLAIQFQQYLNQGLS